MSQEKSDLEKEFLSFCRTIAALRDPESGCPWDLKQNHATLRKYMIEEAYEAATEMESGHATPELCEELGDVLLQVVLNAQVAEDNGKFDILDVVKSINEKMIRRHPHVFDPNHTEYDEGTIKGDWDRIKEEEKRNEKKKRYFSDAEKVQPASSKAEKIGKLASKINFDWSSPEEVLDQLQSEVDELREAINLAKDCKNSQEVELEMSDVFFTAVQLARHLDLDAEATFHLGNNKFLKRFEILEDLALKEGVDVVTADKDRLEELWKASKVKILT